MAHTLKYTLITLAAVGFITSGASASEQEHHERGEKHHSYQKKAAKKALKSSRTASIKDDDKTQTPEQIAALAGNAHAREELMEAAQLAKKTASSMLKGKIEWNSKIAELAMRTIQSVSFAIGHKVPEGSLTDESDASPDIWTHMDDFQALAAELEDKSDKAAKAARVDLKTFKPAFEATLETCSSCHKKYRIRKKS